MTQRGTEALTYDILNKPTRISGGTVSDFVYDADHQLVKQVVNGVTTLYLGNVEIILEGLTTTTSSYIDGSIQYRYFNNGVTGAGGEYHYLHRDHLGSVEAISNGAGYFKSRMSFDAWGNRRMDNWTRGNPTITSPTKQGYTGHEQLDQHKLVHMQGRVYDPVLGRFLSADPYIQAPHNTQSYNRYSYVFNNPLSFTDPSGYQATNVNGPSPGAPSENIDCNVTPEMCSTVTGQDSSGYSGSGGYEMTGAGAWTYAQDLQNWVDRTSQYTPSVLFPGGMSPSVINEIFLQDAVKAVDAVGNGDVTGAVVSVAMAVIKPLKVADKVNDIVKKVDSLGAKGRSGAFNEAKRDLGIPRGRQPDSVSRAPMTDINGKTILGGDGKPIMTREYTYTREDGSKVVIQDHSAGHKFNQGGVGDQGSHFNVRPAENTRTGSVPGTQDHYSF